MPCSSSRVRAVRTMRDGSAGSGFQNAISVMRYASAVMRSAKPKAWKVSTLRAWMPSACPISSRPAAAVDDAGRDARELGQLRGGDHAGRAGAHDQHVDLVGKLLGAVDADAGRGLDAGVTGHVTVVVELRQHASIFSHPGTHGRFSRRDRCGLVLDLIQYWT